MSDTTARPIGSVVQIDPESNLPVEIIIYKEQASGALFGIDASYVEYRLDGLDDEPLLVPSVFDNGQVELLDQDS